MPRPRRTDVDDLVFPICNELFAAGQDPQTRALRAKLLERGQAIGQNLVQESLDRWRETERPQRAGIPTEPLAPELTRLLVDWLARDRAAARGELEVEVGTLRTEKQDLLAACSQRDEECARLSEQVAQLTRDRDTLAGQHAEQTAELERVTADLDRERQAAESARLELAKRHLAAEQSGQQLTALMHDLESARTNWETEQKTRIEAQRQQASLQSKSEALTERVDDLLAREKAALAELTALRADLARAREEQMRATREAGAAEASLARADAQIQTLQSALTECRAENERLVRDNSRLAEQARTNLSTKESPSQRRSTK
jgi:chromosome segregation ATPase